ncbi:hypothetical protein RAA17_09485 [Komagataeibacter rhaeticus]|nr:hypothetical protein [Komagataeibacter rhaeticus]
MWRENGRTGMRQALQQVARGHANRIDHVEIAHEILLDRIRTAYDLQIIGHQVNNTRIRIKFPDIGNKYWCHAGFNKTVSARRIHLRAMAGSIRR